ncbi:hypothetical protein ACFX12_017081 [Malus domestica]
MELETPWPRTCAQWKQCSTLHNIQMSYRDAISWNLRQWDSSIQFQAHENVVIYKMKGQSCKGEDNPAM